MFPIEPIVRVGQTEYFILVHYYDKEQCAHKEHKYFASTNICCLNHSKHPVRAEIEKDFFYIYENGLRDKCSRSDTLEFLGYNEEKYVASIINNKFLIQKKSESDSTVGGTGYLHCDEDLTPFIKYLDWNKEKTVTNISKWIL